MELYLALKNLRESQKKTAKQVAAHLGVSEDMVRRYDSGRNDISLRQAERYANFLGETLADVLPGRHPSPTEIKPLVEGLTLFDIEDRREVIDRVARDLTFWADTLRRRSLPETTFANSV